MKFKEGDIVRTKHMEPHEIDPNGLTYYPSFVRNENKQGIIVDVHEARNTYYVKIPYDNTWWYEESWLEHETFYEPY